MNQRKDYADFCVLVLDHDHHFRKQVLKVVEDLGFGMIYQGEDGARGLELLNLIEVDLIIAAGNMTPLGGRDFARIVRRDCGKWNQQVPIILASLEKSPSIVRDARDSGINEFVAKPFAPGVLISRIDKALKDKRAFITTSAYVGPDRRRHLLDGFHGQDRRHLLNEVSHLGK